MPVLCIGETLEQRQAGETEKVLSRQLKIALKGVPLEKLIVAYEPVWAIGTGVNAAPQQVREAHAFIKKCLREFGPHQIPVLYGGSVKPENVSQIAMHEEVDGVLVGGASLDPHAFAQIVLHCSKKGVS
jgi:triosephosphate isomerase